MFSVNFSQERENMTNSLQMMDLTPMMTSVGDREAACFYLLLEGLRRQNEESPCLLWTAELHVAADPRNNV